MNIHGPLLRRNGNQTFEFMRSAFELFFPKLSFSDPRNTRNTVAQSIWIVMELFYDTLMILIEYYVYYTYVLAL